MAAFGIAVISKHEFSLKKGTEILNKKTFMAVYFFFAALSLNREQIKRIAIPRPLCSTVRTNSTRFGGSRHAFPTILTFPWKKKRKKNG